MPIALDKTRPTLRLVLKSDEHKPEAEQPHFIYRYLTGSEWRYVAHIDDEIAEKRETLTAGESVTMLFDALATGLQSVGNMPEIDNDIARLEEVLGIFELRELVQGMLIRSMLGPEAKNASGSPSPGNTDESASPAPETAAAKDKAQPKSEPSATDAE